MKKIDWKYVAMFHAFMAFVFGFVTGSWINTLWLIIVSFGFSSVVIIYIIASTAPLKKTNRQKAEMILDKYYPTERTIYRDAILKAMEEYKNTK